MELEGYDGQMKAYNGSGALTVHISGKEGSLKLGGGVSDGELMIKDNKGNTTILLDGNGGVINVNGSTITPADFVFEANYGLPKIEEVGTFIQTNKHLPNVPSGAEMKANGLNLNAFSMTLLQKVEELTLYLIEQNNQLKAQQAEIDNLKRKLEVKN